MGLVDKYLADVENKELQKILERAANYNWVLCHIRGNDNEIACALSRLYTQICLDSHNYVNKSPRLLQKVKERQ